MPLEKATTYLTAVALSAAALTACGGGGGGVQVGSGGTSAASSAAASSASSTASSSVASSATGGNASSASSSSLASSSLSSTASALPAPVDLQVPTLAYDDTSITLVWKKPDDYSKIVDYRVYMNGKPLGLASANNSTHSPAKPYIDAFYAADAAGFHRKITFQNFLATGLAASTSYSFTVRSIDAAGNESADSTALVWKTAAGYAKVVNLASAGAVGDGATVNTTVIQNAIDTCASGSTSAYGCKVIVPATAASGKVFVSGALFLRSNMTLEIEEGATLKGATLASEYPLNRGYQLYSYFTNSTDDRRPPSLLNLLSTSHMNGSSALTDHQGYDDSRGSFTNIRIVGKGTLDGSGWVRSSTDTVDEIGNKLAYYEAGSASKWSTLGLLAKNQMLAAQTEVGTTLNSTQNANYYSNRRSSLATFRGARNIYVGGLMLLNPAYHGVMFLESENIVFAGTRSQTYDINNADGVEFGNSDNAMIFNNFFDTGDDDVNFAAGQGADYENALAQQNAWIFNNYMREGHGAVVAGSHTGGWIQDILAEDNVMYHTDNGLRLKSTPATGGGARRITFRDNAMKDMSTNAFIFTLAYSAGSNVFSSAGQCARFHDISIRNVSVDNIGAGGAPIAVDGYAGTDATLPYPETFQEAISFDTLKITNAKSATSISRLKNSSFKDVTITNSPSTFWVFSNSSGNSFTNVSPAP
ncbi:glycoside hydrolase family 28 protein [Uliginosibacterium paludis]|uniref:Glycoside hydrolase family 28 protein n=1 Tax=Uliginosibacterium paludis TaxID=1615952 RepID=A0ABV2CUI6_9RHOO